MLREVCECGVPKAGQNFKYDVKWLRVIEHIIVKNLVFDTMLAQHLLDEQRSTHGLDYMVRQCVPSMAGYSDELYAYRDSHKEANPQIGGSYANVPWDILIPYSAGDSDAGIRVKHIIEDRLWKFNLGVAKR